MPQKPEDIIKQHQQKIYWLALSIARNEKDAEDILQNTLIKILRKLPGFKQRSKLSTWIYRVAYNEALMFLRKKRRLFNSSNALREYNQRLPKEVLINWSRLPDKELLDKELRGRIESALNELPIKYRMPLLLHRLQGLSLQDCVGVLGVEVSTVKTRLHRAYLMVKEQIGEYDRDLPETSRISEQSCGRWMGFIFDYAQEKLHPERKKDFQRHIRGCSGCNDFLDSYLKAIRITGALDCRDLPKELKEKLSTFLRTVSL